MIRHMRSSPPSAASATHSEFRETPLEDYHRRAGHGWPVGPGVSVASHRELDRFLLDHTARTLQERLSPVIDTYLHRLAGTGLPLDALARDLARDLTTHDVAALVLDADGRPLASGKILPDDM